MRLKHIKMIEIDKKRQELEALIAEVRGVGSKKSGTVAAVPKIDMYSVFDVHNLKMEVEDREGSEKPNHH